MKIFIGLTDIAGYCSSLKRGFDEIGVESIFVSLYRHPFQYRRDDDNEPILKAMYRLQENRDRSTSIVALMYNSLLLVLRFCLFIKVLISCDVFLFCFMDSFFDYHELPVLKLFRKKIIYLFLGSDSRPLYINGKFLDLPVEELIDRTSIQKQKISKIEKYADIIINHPPSAHYHERRFVQFMRLGFPLSCPEIKEVKPQATRRIPRILHAPSVAKGKGTDRIVAALEILRSKGHCFEYVEIQGKPNSVVIDELSRCDFVVDELYSDAVMAGFAAEAAFFGKPAIVGGYVTDRDLGDLPDGLLPPVHRCLPEQIEDAIDKLLTDVPYRQDLGRRAQEFVKQTWSSREVAERYLRIIQGSAPPDWSYDPAEIRYLHGWGLTELQARTLVHRYLDAGGVSALHLADKPRLVERFREFSCEQGCT